MSRNNTGNPIGSKAFPDFEDNVKNLDQAVNAEQDTFQDRLGKSRLTWAGMESQFESDQSEREVKFDADQSSREQEFRTFIASSGYQFAGDYAAGIEITQYNQIIRDENGEFWRVSGQVDLPYVTTGAGIPEDDALVPAGDAVLRQDLANPDKGALMVRGAVIYANTIADLQALDTSEMADGQKVSVLSYHAPASPSARFYGGGAFAWDSGRSKADHNGGTVIDPSVPFSASSLVNFWDGVGGSSGNGVFTRVTSGNHASIDWWGPLRNNDFDDALAAERARLVSSNVQLGYGVYYFKSTYISGAQSSLKGQGGKFWNPATTIVGDVAALGNDQPILQITDGTSTLQNSTFSGFKLQGSVSRSDWNSQDATDDTGINGIDVSNCKETVNITDVSYRYIKRGIYTRESPGGYLGELNIRNSQWAGCYIGIDAFATVPISLTDSLMDNGMINWINTTSIGIKGCSFNNQVVDALGRNCSISAARISIDDTWFEGGATQVQLVGDLASLSTRNVTFGTASGRGSNASRYHIGLTDSCTVELFGGRTGSTTRLFVDDFSDVITDYSSVYIDVVGVDVRSTVGFLRNAHSLGLGRFNYQCADTSAMGYDKPLLQTSSVIEGALLKAKPNQGAATNFSQNNCIRLSSAGTIRMAGFNQTSCMEFTLQGSNQGAGGTSHYFGRYIACRAVSGDVSIRFLYGDDVWTLTVVNAGTDFIEFSASGNHSGGDFYDVISFEMGYLRSAGTDLITVETGVAL